ncbi:MAG TPA: RAMP superfamily CRISPR-associated protein [Gammaproteobacteria bacterium]|nr:RAMP superfamily CRISPR-associated protein [Gammaproteobacteria bacterium]
MAEHWVRYIVMGELLSDAHLGSGSGGGGIDALVARDRNGRPVIWASHIEGVLRDAARRLRGEQAASAFFGRAAGDRQRAVFTSLYTSNASDTHVWRSAAREAFDNRAPKDETLRAVEYVPKGTKFEGQVELPEKDLPILCRLSQEVDAFGSGRAAGAGRVRLSLRKASLTPREVGIPTEKIVILLKNLDPLCITATATPDNLIPSLAFVPGRALLGAIAAWLISEEQLGPASLLTSGRISVSDALPLPHVPERLESVEVLPAPLSLQSEKPRGLATDLPWWAQSKIPVRRLDAWSADEKLKRPEDDLFIYRAAPSDPWITFRPVRRVRLRNGRPDPRQAEPSLFAIEQIVEETHFLAELQGSPEDMACVAKALAPLLEGRRWLRIGRAGAPVEVVQVAWSKTTSPPTATEKALLTLTSDLLIRDEYLRWRTSLDEAVLRMLLGSDDIQLEKSLQDNVMVHGFNGTSRIWRMPAVAIRRGSVFRLSGAGVGELAKRAANGQWLGERTHEGFGRFRLDVELPGVTDGSPSSSDVAQWPDDPTEGVAEETKTWFEQHRALAAAGGERKPSLSQWLDLAADLERGETNAVHCRLEPTTAGRKSWKHKDAKAILQKLESIDPAQRAAYARFFVRWLRAALRCSRDKGAA